jgi:uncharacterized membrane protein YphA (DoxX/SURF4 family)
MKKRTILETIIVLYTILFLYTAISKFQDYSVFNEQLSDSPLLAPISKSVAWGLPLIELLIVLLLLVPRWRLKGLFVTASLMVLFSVYVVCILIFDKALPCSCGGIIQQLSWPQHLIFNSIFLLLAIWGIRLEKIQRKERKVGRTLEKFYPS